MGKLEVFYRLNGKRMVTAVRIEEDFVKDGYYIWQKVIKVLHDKHNIVNITNIEIGYWSEIK